MKINKSYIPLKAHFFFFFGGVAPIEPFMTVVAVQLGIPLSIQGAVLAVCLLLPIVIKPIIAVLADIFSHLRKMIFMVVLVFVFGGYSSIWFIPPLAKTTVLLQWEFWMYALLVIIGQMNCSIAHSISDAIAVDSTNEYGNQRAWGTIGFTIAAPLSGLLVDLWSGSSITKDYSPAFLLVLILGCIDLVPQIEGNPNIWKIVRPLLLQPTFSTFCCFVVLSGMFDGIIYFFVFTIQEEIAQGTNAMRYIKFLQGLSIAVQSLPEALFMFTSGWFIKRLGPQRVTSLVFFVFTFRLLGLSLAIYYGSLWATILTETLHGITYGLGYPAIVKYAAEISPSGTSTTIQSIVNNCYECLGFALATLFGGILLEAFGGFMTYLVTGITCFMVFILHVLVMMFLPATDGYDEGVSSPILKTAAGKSKENFSFIKEEAIKTSQTGN